MMDEGLHHRHSHSDSSAQEEPQHSSSGDSTPMQPASPVITHSSSDMNGDSSPETVQENSALKDLQRQSALQHTKISPIASPTSNGSPPPSPSTAATSGESSPRRTASDVRHALWEEKVTAPIQNSIHNFFYPKHASGQASSSSSTAPAGNHPSEPPPQIPSLGTNNNNGNNNHLPPDASNHHPTITLSQSEQDRLWVEKFWKTYDDIVFISIFTQLGMIFRIGAAHWFAYFDDTFRHDSALFVNLPLNCLSAWILGFLCSGRDVMQILDTRVVTTEQPKMPVPSSAQEQQQDEGRQAEALLEEEGDGLIEDSDDAEGIEDDDVEHGPMSPTSPSHSYSAPRSRGVGRFHANGLRRRGRRLKRQRDLSNSASFGPTTWTTPKRVGDAEYRQVQLQAYERRIRASLCVVLFPAKKEDIDVMEHYADNEMGAIGARRITEQPHYRQEQLQLSTNHSRSTSSAAETSPTNGSNGEPHHSTRHAQQAEQEDEIDYPTQRGGDRDLDQILQDVSSNITTNIQDVSTNLTDNMARIQRVSLAEGWDLNTTAQAMSADLMLGLRDGFCGALSSFSSWNSSMVTLIRNGQISDALAGYAIGMQLPIVAYRFGQHMAVYLFMWRCRREKRKDEKRGYGIRLSQNDHVIIEDDEEDEDLAMSPHSLRSRTSTQGSVAPTEDVEEQETPSVRAIATALLVMFTVTQLSSLFFFTDPQQKQLALSLLFSPLGVLTRWRLSKWNRFVPGFPIGTFTSNMLSCALNGSFGRLLAGNPGENERYVLVSIVSGFAGSLSSVSTLVVEVLAGVDPLLFRFDGFTYATCTIFWGVVIGMITLATVNWADEASGVPPELSPTIDDDDLIFDDNL